MKNNNHPGLVMMGAFAMGVAALVIVAWAEDAQREMQLPKPVPAITSVTV